MVSLCRTLGHGSPPDGHMFPAVAAGSPETLEEGVDRQVGSSALHDGGRYAAGD